MDDALKRKIADYADKAYAAAHHTSTQQASRQIVECTARLASQGVILSGQTVREIAQIQGNHINTVVQARADALLDAYELYGAEIDDTILVDVKTLRATLVGRVATSKDSGLPPGVPAFQMFQPLLETNTGAIVNSISCQIELRRVVPKIKRPDLDRRFEEMAIQEARQSVAEDGRAHPKVGAVVVKDGEVVSKAHRGETPKGHAEFIALEGKLSDDLVAGSTVYTTLEPCTTRTHPKIPCAQRLIERRVGRVFIGMLDPNPEIRGLGIQALNDAGIETQFFPRDLQSQIEELNREFIRAQRERQTRANVPSLKTTSEPEANPKVAEISKHKGKIVTIFNRQKYGQGYLEGFWPNGAVLVDCTPLWVVLADPVAKNQQSFSLANVEVTFDSEKDRLQLTIYR
jgi:pyrimidine deaminase RibD-like protein